jgi:hypothetical protein
VSARRITPAMVLIGAALILGFLALLMPRPEAEHGPALDSRSMAPDGARGLYTVLARLRFPVRRGTTRLSGSLSPNATYVLLSPAIPLTAEETNALLAAVRGGATLLFTPGGGALTDSLGFIVSLESPHTIDDTRVIGGPAPRIVTPYAQYSYPLDQNVAITDSAAAVRSTAFMWYPAQVDSSVRAAEPLPQRDTSASGVDAIVLGRTFGRGHAIAVAPASVLTNQLVHTGPPAVAIVRALEWANAAGPVVFDEYHHGAGMHEDPVGAIRDALLDTAIGRAALMALVAALVLLASAAWRPIAPVHVATVQRRSPLEHVQALARAYLQTHADRLGAERLVRGLRRRHPLGLPRNVSDRVYLETVRARYPAAAGDASVAIRALESGRDAHIVPVRDAVARIEDAVRAA